MYSAATGIWQTVWLEPVPTAHIDSLKITPDIDASQLRLTVLSNGNASVNTLVKVSVMANGKSVASSNGNANAQLVIPLANAKLWSPDAPFLYDLKVTLGKGQSTNSVDSYFAMRKVSLGKDAQGRTRIFLNNKFVFQVGALDQGYWPDGIFTAPTDQALRYDIETAKALGFNLLRKHTKVEPDRWYHHADKLGMLVWQDMPQAFGDGEHFSDANKAQWLLEWKREIATHFNHPSIIVWTTFNENWGQHNTEAIVALTKQLDPTRLVNNASGFVDKGVGDLNDTHDYPGPGSAKPEANRAAVCGEFGGITMLVEGHRWDNGYVGYGGLVRNDWHLAKRYQVLLQKAYSLSATQGTSAVVYTQLTDVEQESNGLMTYDRAVIKSLAEVITAANKGVFTPLPPSPEGQIVPTPKMRQATGTTPSTNPPTLDAIGLR